MTEIIKVQHENRILEIEVQSREAFESLPPREQRHLVEKADLASDIAARDEAIRKTMDRRVVDAGPVLVVKTESDPESIEKALGDMEVAIAKASSSFDAGLEVFAMVVGKTPVV